MSFRRILLKNRSGVPVASVTLTDRRPIVTLPDGITALLCLGEEIYPPIDGVISLPAGDKPLSILAEKAGELLFGSTLNAQEAAFAKWRLLTALEEKKSTPLAPTESLEKRETDEVVEQAESAEDALQKGTEEILQTEQSSPLEESETSDGSGVPSKLERAEALLRKGTPFTLFDSVMPGSRWAIIKEDAAEYLIGITGEGEESRILFGVPGARDFPPDEDRLWSFFPSEESEEMGYFLTEAEEI